ncbi:MAG: hypothetical protein ABSF53_21285 [Terracidiphilus sp.]
MVLFGFAGFRRVFSTFVVILFLASNSQSRAQQLNESSLIPAVDAAVKTRFEAIAAYTVTEHYAVFRNGDETHTVAEMVVKTNYRRESGKSYTILSESGSTVIRRLVLDAILDREKQINEPGVREHAWITSSNYEMKLKPGGTQRVDGRDCFDISINPRQKAPNLVIGEIWVDARDGSLVLLKGTASKSVSAFAAPAEMMRQYATVDGFSMATHVRAVSKSFLFGTATVTIDYTDYQIQVNAKP